MAGLAHYSINIADDTVSALTFSIDKRELSVMEGDSIGFDGPESMIDGLERLLSRGTIGNGSCSLAFGPEHFFYRSFTVPFSDQKQVSSILAFEIQDSVSLSADEYVFDYILEKKGEEETRVFAILIKKTLIRTVLSALEEYHLDPEVITISGLPALQQQSQMVSPGTSSFTMLTVGMRYGALYLVSGEQVRLIRSIPVDPDRQAGFMIDDETGRVKATHPEMVRAVFTGFVKQVKNTLTARYSDGADYSQSPWYFRGVLGSTEEYGQMLSQLLSCNYMSCDRGIFESLNGFAAFSREQSVAQYDDNLALGAAQLKDLKLINFRKDEFARRHDRKKLVRILRYAAAVCLTAVFFAVIGLTIDFQRMKSQRDTLDSQIAEIYRDTIPGDGRIVNPVQQLQVKVNELKNATSTGSSEHPTMNTLVVLGDISERIPETLKVTFERFIYDRKTIRIKGLTDTFNTVDQMKRYLDKSPYYTDVAIVSANVAPKDDGVRFELKLQM